MVVKHHNSRLMTRRLYFRSSRKLIGFSLRNLSASLRSAPPLEGEARGLTFKGGNLGSKGGSLGSKGGNLGSKGGSLGSPPRGAVADEVGV